MVLAACRGTKFSYVTDAGVQHYGTLHPYHLRNDYDLYTRQVIKVFDSTRNIYVPRNGSVTAGNELIEIEYLLLSKNGKEAIVINNLPNKRFIFYNSADKRAELSDTTAQLKIDIWYFNQFRFGTRNADGDLVFKNVEGSGKDHTWNLQRVDGQTIKVDAVSVSDAFGTELRLVRAAFAIELVFKKADDFLFVFKNNAQQKRFANHYFPLKDQTLHVANHHQKWYVVFPFDTTVSRHFNNVVYFDKRMYAGPQ
jgi:hypothetical protein